MQFGFILLIINAMVLVVINSILCKPTHPLPSSGDYMYYYVHEADFIAQKYKYGDYSIGRYISKSDIHRCFGVNFKDAQERISKEYIEYYPMHPKPIVIKRVLVIPSTIDILGVNLGIILFGTLIWLLLYVIGILIWELL